MTESTSLANEPERPVVPEWPSYMPVRRSHPVMDLVCFLVIVALLVGAAVLYSRPWQSSGRVGGADLARYVPDSDGMSSLFEVRDDADNVVGYESQNLAEVVAAQVVLALPSAVQPSVITAAAVDESTARDIGPDSVASIANLDTTIGALQRAEVYQVGTIDGSTTDAASLQRSATFEVRAPGGLFAAGFVGAAGNVVAFSPPMLAVPARIEDGQTWKGSGTFGSVPFTYQGSITAHGGFDTPMGHFGDCVTTDRTVDVGQAPTDTTLHSVVTLCAGVGVADDRSTTTNQGTSSVRHLTLVRTTQHPSTNDVTLPDVANSPGGTPLSSPDSWQLTRFARTAPTGNSVGATTAPTFVPTSPPEVVVPDETGDVVAYDAATRVEVWRFHAGGAVFSQPSFDAASNTLLFGAADRRVYALDPQGTFKWSFRTGDNVASSPIVVDGVVVAGSEDQKVYGLDVATGAARWTVHDSAAIASSPVAVNGVVAIGDDDGNVLGIDPRTGDQLWTGNLPGAAEGPVTTDGNSLFVGSQGDINSGGVTALDPATGDERWSTQISNPSKAGVAAGDTLVFAVDNTGILYALDRDTGVPRWSTRSLYAGTPVAVGDDAVAVRFDGTVDLFDAAGHVTRAFDAHQTLSPLDEEPSVNLGFSQGGGALWFTDTNALVFRLGPADASAPVPLTPRFVLNQGAPGFGHGPLIVTPVEHDGQVIVVDALGGLAQVDPGSGASVPLGEYDTSQGAVRTEPVVAGDTVLTIIGSDLQAFDLSTRAVRWKASGEGGVALAGPAASPTTAYFVASDRGPDGNPIFDATTGQISATLRAVDVRTGDVVWTAPVPSVQGVAISLAGDEVIAATEPLTAFDAETGAVRWTAPSVTATQGAPAFDEADGLVVAVSATEVVAVDAGTGAVRWRTPLPPQTQLDTAQPVLVDGGTVIVATETPGPLLGFDARTGASRWQFTAPSPRYGTVEATGGATYLVLTDGTVFALSSRDGSIAGTANEVHTTLAAFGLSVARPALIGDTVVFEEGAFVMGLPPAVGR